jgi:UDP-N-acetylmuramate dehydrogenase
MADWQSKAEAALAGIQVIRNISMTKLTTFKIGGPLDWLVELKNFAELEQTLVFCHEQDIPWLIIGLGSNLLVRDKGIRGIGIKMTGDFAKWKVEGDNVTAGAGVVLADLAKETACLGLTGLEFACGIPGSTGGAIFMNAGAYDGEMSRMVMMVEAYDSQTGELLMFSNTELDFGYRYSRFQNQPEKVITSLTLKLRHSDPASITGKITEFTCRRGNSQPLDLPSAGSVFRRPEGYFVGTLIIEAGLQGFSIGGAQVSTKHGGFIVNKGNATAADVLALIRHIQHVIKEQVGVELIPEYRIVGEE